MGEYKVYCYLSLSGKRYIGQTKTSLAQRAGPGGSNYEGCVIFWNAMMNKGVYHPPANPELSRKRKSEAVKKVWERRRKENAGCSR